jgi:hypothetical protein
MRLTPAGYDERFQDEVDKISKDLTDLIGELKQLTQPTEELPKDF